MRSILTTKHANGVSTSGGCRTTLVRASCVSIISHLMRDREAAGHGQCRCIVWSVLLPDAKQQGKATNCHSITMFASSVTLEVTSTSLLIA